MSSSTYVSKGAKNTKQSQRLKSIQEETPAMIPYPEDYRFGIELEFLMRPKDFNEPPNCQSARVREHLVQKWYETMGGELGFVEMESGYPKSRDRTYYAKWRLLDESLRLQSPSGKSGDKWSLEIVSPILHYSEFKNWKHYISMVIGFFVGNTELEIDDNCAFHIHISPIEEKWELTWLKRIATAVIVFDDRMSSLHLIDKRARERFCKSNLTSNPKLKKEERGNIIGKIMDCRTVEALIDLINAKRDDDKDYEHRNYAWNFTGTSSQDRHGKSRKNTVEYRSSRSTTDIDTIIKWIVFVVAFVHASIAGEEFTDVDAAGDLDKFLEENPPPGRTDSLRWEKYK